MPVTPTPSLSRALAGGVATRTALSSAAAVPQLKRGQRFQRWLKALPWPELFSFLDQAADDGLSREEAITAASIVLDGAVDFEKRIPGPLGAFLEANDQRLAGKGLGLAWGLIERRRAAQSGGS